MSEPVPLEPVPEALRPLVTAGMAKDPGARPADGAAFVAELRKVAGWTYGPDWEARGRSALASAALALAALWPAAGSTAAHGSRTVHQVRLLRRLLHGHAAAGKAAAAVAIVAVGAAVAAGVVATHHGRPAEPVDTSFTVSGALGGVAATSSDNAWTVGCVDTSCTKPLILRWNGTTWTRVPSPDLGTDYALNSVAAASADSAWAVGWTGSGTTSETNSRSLILHWNGRTWTRVPSPSPGQDSQLLSVSVTPAGNAWAYGLIDAGLRDTSDTELILRWNGTAWVQVPTPGAGPGHSWIYSVAAVSAHSAWAVGYANNAANILGTLIMRWNGSTWTRVPSPSPEEDTLLTGVAAASADSAWAVGYSRDNTTSRGLVFMHWNGSTWTTAPSPSLVYNVSVLAGVTVTPGGTAWAFGWTDPDASSGTSNGSGERTLILRWNGTAWTRVPSPSPGPSARIGGVTALSSGDAWATGTVGGKTLVLRWNGQRWTGPAGPLPPAVSASSAVPSAAASTVPPVRSSAPPDALRRILVRTAVAPAGGTGPGGVAGPGRYGPGRGHAGRQHRRGLLTWPEPGRGGLQQRRVVASGPAGQARRPARPLGPARVDAGGPHYGLAGIRPRPTRTSRRGRRTRSRTDAARTTSPMPATRPQRRRMTRLRRTRRPSQRCGRRSRTSTACRATGTTRYDGVGRGGTTASRGADYRRRTRNGWDGRPTAARDGGGDGRAGRRWRRVGRSKTSARAQTVPIPTAAPATVSVK